MLPHAERKKFFNSECMAKFVIIMIVVMGMTAVISALLFINFNANVFKALVVAIGVAVLIICALGWKMVNLAFEPVTLPPPTIHSSMLLRYNYECAAREAGYFNGSQFVIPRPSVSPDPNGPPSRLAPPPPPTYDMSETVASSTAPPPYSSTGGLRRTSSNTPPPAYDDAAINSPPPVRPHHVVIDCSKAEPSLFNYPGAESVI